MIDERIITMGIIEKGMKKLLDAIENDIIIVGGGPSGLTAGYYLAKKGFKVSLFEKTLRVGGGMPGGGNGFPFIVVQKEAKDIMEEFKIKYEEYKDGYYIADSIESISKLTSSAIDAGVSIFNLITCEDVVLIENKVCGIVIISTAILNAGFHVDPLSIRSRFVIDATGHAAEVTRTLVKKGGIKLNTPTGDIIGEKPMWADYAENSILENTREVFPGLWVCGMAANAVFGSPRMGPIFGGMLLSGREVASKISKILKEK
uniref:Thiamine thiazole synthase n=1 Tax=candidate division WOR-3 bacterium TaxID=2052148 RepID=A0A7C4U8P8_UNCW3